jgi:hypothetical protein
VLIRVEETPALWASEICPHCEAKSVGGYDHAPERRRRHLNVCQMESEIWGFVSGAIGLVTGNAFLLGLHGVGYDFKSHGHTILVALFTLVHLAGFAGSLALCWWLFYRKGKRFGRWLNRLLYRRATWVLAFVTLYLLSLSIPLISGGALTLLITAVGRETVGEIVLPQSYSSIIMHLTTPVVFIGLTLFLARKRLRVSQA